MTIPSSRLHAQEAGSGRQALLLLHGFGGSGADWAGLVPRLSEAAHVLVYDLPGHGGSLDHPGSGGARNAARAILADLDARGIEHAHVAGHSMGGAVAALMAIAAPERIASLTLLAPGGFGEEIAATLLRRYAAAAGAEDIRACLAEMSGPGHEVPERSVEERLAARQRPGQTARLVEIASAMTRDGRQGMIPRELLAGLKMPVSVLWGTLDPVLPPGQAADLPPAFRLRRIPGAGHMLIDEAPGAVMETILAALGPERGDIG
ncbi:alpha/beta fold hydrolase [Mesorhizobium sp. SP-1A]|uniref:alpha/beta fold hydrolase n=1 Tax=Mesorhizobium sp. SP-1A TaxID=3077840 RepID=UPI0028F74CF7|nr:alpha/beta fold hydrolase [Mesorhizobium sp. SP-1A]